METPKIRVSGLRYAVGGVEILKGVSAEVGEGGITAAVGPSGAGKSTLLRAANRLIEPTAGEVYLDGRPTGGMDLLRLRWPVGMVFQLPASSALRWKAVLYGARLIGLDADAARLLEIVGLDRALAGWWPGSVRRSRPPSPSAPRAGRRSPRYSRRRLRAPSCRQ